MKQDITASYYIKTNHHTQQTLLTAIRRSLSGKSRFNLPYGAESLPFNSALSQVYITLFQPGLKPLRWGARRSTLETSLQRVMEKLREIPAFNAFAVADSHKCRIMFEMVIAEEPCHIKKMTGMKFGSDRFEPGITGLKYVYQEVTRYFMPTDAVVHSIMSVSQLLRYLAKKSGVAKRTNRFSEREQLMRTEPIDYSFIYSIAYISFQQEALTLYRGYPAPVQFDRAQLLDCTTKSIDWLVDNMNPDGSFLYFYDSYSDSKVDFDHPKMVDPLYYNILRHSGGTITLLRGYELTQNPDYLQAATRSLKYFCSTLRKHQYRGAYACYPFDNEKSKLGGAGIGLVALMHYYRHTGDESYRQQMDGLVRHILSRVDADGEMIGYYIHPLYNQGKPLINPPDAVKRLLFSFYYPGEALLGLALYYQWIENIDPELKTGIANKSEKALDFLVDIRPVKYQELFLELPADAWLMQAIEEWVKVDGFNKQRYIDFVFNDADAMIGHSYTEENAPYHDYVGGFYYNYGDHVYHDGSRCEGLIAAYYLALYLNQHERADRMMAAIMAAAKGLMRTRNTAASTYSHLHPEKSINSFRFKLTRQWVRVDSVQHTACFYARLYERLRI